MAKGYVYYIPKPRIIEPKRPLITGAAQSVVSDKFTASTSYADQAWNLAVDSFSDLSGFNFGFDAINKDLALNVDTPNVGERPSATRPADYSSGMVEISFPDLAELRANLGLDEVTVRDVTLPNLGVVAPSVDLPSPPDDPLPEVPLDPPNFTKPPIPAAPDYTLPDVPVLEDIPIPAAPSVSIPAFEGTLPSRDLVAPEPTFVYTEGQYQSDLLDALNTKLYADITNGGTGLAAEVEAAIYDRARQRRETENERMYTEAETYWSARGWEQPPGVLSARLDEINREISRANGVLSQEIMIDQAKLAQQNTQFAITSGMEVEKTLIDHFNRVAQRSLEAATAEIEAAIAIFNGQVAAYNAELQAYQTQAQVYESRIRAEIAQVEIYKAQLEGAKVAGELQSLSVSIYSERVKAIGTLIDLYATEMQGAKIASEVEGLSLEAYRSKIEGISAAINAVTAKYNLYQAEIAGEEAKVRIYSEQVKAFGEQVDAAQVESQINIAEAQAAIEANKEKVAVLEAAIEKYKAEVEMEVAEEAANIKAFEAKVDMYEAEQEAVSRHVNNLIGRYEAQVAEASQEKRLLIDQAEANLKAATALKEIQVEALKSGSNVLSQMASSALASVSASAQIGYNEQLSNSYSGSESASYTGSHVASSFAFTYNF